MIGGLLNIGTSNEYTFAEKRITQVMNVYALVFGSLVMLASIHNFYYGELLNAFIIILIGLLFFLNLLWNHLGKQLIAKISMVYAISTVPFINLILNGGIPDGQYINIPIICLFSVIISCIIFDRKNEAFYYYSGIIYYSFYILFTDKIIYNYSSPPPNIEFILENYGYYKIPLILMSVVIVVIITMFKDLIFEYETSLIKASADLKKKNSELTSAIKNVDERTKELSVVNKELESFNHSITHDLRAPLRAIEGFVDVIKEEYFDQPDKEAKRLFGIIQTNVTRMSDLIRDLLKFSKLGNEELKLKSCDLNELINHALEEAGNSFNYTKVKVNKLPVKRVDRSMMQQVFVNLLSNAFKFSKNKTSPEIEIGSYKSEEGKDIVFIKDNGVGFDINYKNKLFSIFQRLHSEEDFEGTGIGLSIVKRIIDKHHGEIWCESEIDQGTTFYFSLP